MVVLGLTGGIASGKSTVSRMLKSRGAAIIDADQLAREAVAPGSDGLAEVIREFGPEVIGPKGALDRSFLGRMVFADAGRRHALEQIVHPRVFSAMLDQLGKLRLHGYVEVAVLDVPLLFETKKALRLCDLTAVVWVPETIQIDRLMKRDHLSREEALQRIRAQIPLDAKRNLADITIDNSGTPEATELQAQSLWERLMMLGR